MKRILTVIALVMSLCAHAGGQIPHDQAAQEMNAGRRAYQAGRFPEAQRHFERAYELNPAQPDALFFIANAIRAQYHPNDESPENVAQAQAAIAAYQRVLEREPRNEDAYAAVANLYAAIGDEVQRREWIMRRALDESQPPERRAEAYVVLASLQWNCSFNITEQSENKQTVSRDGRAVLAYRMPQDRAAYDEAYTCASEGLRLVEEAIRLNPESENAWGYKTSLLREMAKLAEMDGQPEMSALYAQQADESQRRTAGLSMRGQSARTLAASEVVAPVPPRGAIATNSTGPVPVTEAEATSQVPPPPPLRGPIAGGVLNGRAISKPPPAYPVEARAARASGVVTVQIIVDEVGAVISARAVNGHPLLQPAAVQAAYQARFTPTLLSGVPVKVSGVITYNFVLQ